MRAAFQGEEGKQSELLRTERRRDQAPAHGEGREAQERKEHVGHLDIL